MENNKKWYIKQTLISFLVVLFAMPLGHGAMKLMERFMNEGSLHVAGFMIGLIGLVMVIIGFMGTIRWAPLLDGMGRVSLYVLCAALRRSARDRAWCGGDTT